MTRAWLAALLLLTGATATADADRQLAASLLAISPSRLPEALDTVDRLTHGHPDFPSDQLHEETRRRVRGLSETLPSEKLPGYLLDLPDDSRRTELASALDAGRADWESRDTGRLMARYSASFRNGKQDFAAFAASKRQVNAGKTWIKVGLDRFGLMPYPDRPDFALVSFEQNHQSNNLSDRTAKRQFWSRENGRWKIVHETSL